MSAPRRAHPPSPPSRMASCCQHAPRRFAQHDNQRALPPAGSRAVRAAFYSWPRCAWDAVAVAGTPRLKPTVYAARIDQLTTRLRRAEIAGARPVARPNRHRDLQFAARIAIDELLVGAAGGRPPGPPCSHLL